MHIQNPSFLENEDTLTVIETFAEEINIKIRDEYEWTEEQIDAKFDWCNKTMIQSENNSAENDNKGSDDEEYVPLPKNNKNNNKHKNNNMNQNNDNLIQNENNDNNLIQN